MKKCKSIYVIVNKLNAQYVIFLPIVVSQSG